MKIAYIDHVGDLGGAEHVLLELLAGLRQDVLPILVCGDTGPFPERARQLGVETLITKLPTFFSVSMVWGKRKIINPIAVLWNVISVLRAAKLISSVLRRNEVQIIQTNSNFAHLYGGLAARVLGLPCVWYFHDLIERDRLMGLTMWFWNLLSRLLATRVVAVSRAVADGLSDSSWCSVIYTGQAESDPDPSDTGLRAQLGLAEKAILVGYVGRIGYSKGLDYLVDACEIVAQSDDRVHFIIVGESLFGEVAFKTGLQRLVERNGLGQRWHWLGYDPNISATIKQFDVLVLPSRREALGLVLLEAGMAGKAVVASRVGGIPEIVIDGETGVLVSPHNPSELAKALLTLIENPTLANQMGANARERIRSRFSLNRYYAEFVRLYSSVQNSTSS